jgi:hypothetical protein
MGARKRKQPPMKRSRVGVGGWKEICDGVALDALWELGCVLALWEVYF